MLFLTLFLFRIFFCWFSQTAAGTASHSRGSFPWHSEANKEEEGGGTFSLFINLSLLGAERRRRRGWRYREAKKEEEEEEELTSTFSLFLPRQPFFPSSFLLSLLSSPSFPREEILSSSSPFIRGMLDNKVRDSPIAPKMAKNRTLTFATKLGFLQTPVSWWMLDRTRRNGERERSRLDWMSEIGAPSSSPPKNVLPKGEEWDFGGVGS